LNKLCESVKLDLLERLTDVEVADSHLDGHHLSSDSALVHKTFEELYIHHFVLVRAICDQPFKLVELPDSLKILWVQLLRLSNWVIDKLLCGKIVKDKGMNLVPYIELSLKKLV